MDDKEYLVKTIMDDPEIADQLLRLAQTTTEDRRLAAITLYSLWDKWIDSLPEPTDAPSNAPLETETAYFFTAMTGAAPSSRLAWLYAAFCAGANAGLELFNTLESKQ